MTVMTWMSRISYLDTAADLSTALLAQTASEAGDALMMMIWGYDEEQMGFGWNHPVVRMWTGYEVALAAYQAALSVELVSRGVFYNDHALSRHAIDNLRRTEPAPLVLPPWREDTDVLRSHRSNMERRWPGEYSWKGTPDRMPYLWPFPDEDGGYGLYLSKHDKTLLAKGDRSLPISVKKRIVNV